MKVSVYVLPEGRRDVLIQASPGSGLAPVLLQEVPRGKVSELILPVVLEMRRDRAARRAL